MLSIEPLEGASFGGEASGIDLAEGADDETLRALVDAVHEHRILVVRGQRLTEDQYLAFGRSWGTPIPHVLDHLRMPGYPEMMAIGNYGGEWKDNDAVRNGATFWHTDQSYEAVPSSVTMLYSIRAPETGGETQVADLKRAFDTLPVETRQRLEGKYAWHLYGAASGRGDEAVANPLITEQQVERVPPVRHLIIRSHDVTGRKTLYAVAGHPLRNRGNGRGRGRVPAGGDQAARAPGAVHLPPPVSGGGHRDLRHHPDPALRHPDRPPRPRGATRACSGASVCAASPASAPDGIATALPAARNVHAYHRAGSDDGKAHGVSSCLVSIRNRSPCQ